MYIYIFILAHMHIIQTYTCCKNDDGNDNDASRMLMMNMMYKTDGRHDHSQQMMTG